MSGRLSASCGGVGVGALGFKRPSRATRHDDPCGRRSRPAAAGPRARGGQPEENRRAEGAAGARADPEAGEPHREFQCVWENLDPHDQRVLDPAGICGANRAFGLTAQLEHPGGGEHLHISVHHNYVHGSNTF